MALASPLAGEEAEEEEEEVVLVGEAGGECTSESLLLFRDCCCVVCCCVVCCCVVCCVCCCCGARCRGPSPPARWLRSSSLEGLLERGGEFSPSAPASPWSRWERYWGDTDEGGSGAALWGRVCKGTRIANLSPGEEVFSGLLSHTPL